jgi:polyphenol oxidase
VNLSANRSLAGLSHIRYDEICRTAITAAISLKRFWVDRENRDRDFLRSQSLCEIGFPDYPIATAGQVHRSQVLAVDAAGHFPDTDGLVTNTPGLFLSIVVADCLPIYLWDYKAGCIGLIHAGWRGSAAQIVKKGVETLQNRYSADPANLSVLMGPGICADCYEIGFEVAAVFQPQELTPGRDERFLLDLKAANHRQLLEVGVAEEHIISDDLCPRCRHEELCSYRAEGAQAGRMIATLGLTG